MKDKRSIADLRVGEWGVINTLECRADIRRRLLDLGLAPGVAVGCIGVAPLGDPRAYRVRGKTVALREIDARGVII